MRLLGTYRNTGIYIYIYMKMNFMGHLQPQIAAQTEMSPLADTVLPKRRKESECEWKPMKMCVDGIRKPSVEKGRCKWLKSGCNNKGSRCDAQSYQEQWREPYDDACVVSNDLQEGTVSAMTDMYVQYSTHDRHVRWCFFLFRTCFFCICCVWEEVFS